MKQNWASYQNISPSGTNFKERCNLLPTGFSSLFTTDQTLFSTTESFSFFLALNRFLFFATSHQRFFEAKYWFRVESMKKLYLNRYQYLRLILAFSYVWSKFQFHLILRFSIFEFWVLFFRLKTQSNIIYCYKSSKKFLLLSFDLILLRIGFSICINAAQTKSLRKVKLDFFSEHHFKGCFLISWMEGHIFDVKRHFQIIYPIFFPSKRFPRNSES